MRILLTLITILSLSISSAQYKIVQNEMVWQMVYEKDLNIESQKITYKGFSAWSDAFIYWIQTADMIVEKKDGRTRVTVKNWATANKTSIGVVGGGIIAGGTIEYNLSRMAIKRKKQVIRKSFLGEPARKLHNQTREIIGQLHNGENNDW